jgi:hypothetical protein
MCVFVAFSYPACNAHEPRCLLGPVRLYRNFPHYLKNSKIFEKKIMSFNYFIFYFLAIKMFSCCQLNFWSYEVNFAATRETAVLPATAHTGATDAMELCVITMSVCLSAQKKNIRLPKEGFFMKVDILGVFEVPSNKFNFHHHLTRTNCTLY